MTRAPNAVAGARRRSATGKKTVAMNSSANGSLVFPTTGRYCAEIARSKSAMNPPITQSIATQCLVRMRFVNGGRGSVVAGSG